MTGMWMFPSLFTKRHRNQPDNDVTFATAELESSDEESTSIPTIELGLDPVDPVLPNNSSGLCLSPLQGIPLSVHTTPVYLDDLDIDVPSTSTAPVVATPVVLDFDGCLDSPPRPQPQEERAAYVSVTAFNCGRATTGSKGIGLRIESVGGRLMISAILSNSLFSGTLSELPFALSGHTSLRSHCIDRCNKQTRHYELAMSW
jgi:hypothetical protein